MIRSRLVAPTCLLVRFIPNHMLRQNRSTFATLDSTLKHASI